MNNKTHISSNPISLSPFSLVSAYPHSASPFLNSEALGFPSVLPLELPGSSAAQASWSQLRPPYSDDPWVLYPVVVQPSCGSTVVVVGFLDLVATAGLASRLGILETKRHSFTSRLKGVQLFGSFDQRNW
ncbi:hypothetical protein SLEP1_g38821 [Rubroshorea leprosula]|uniref:Uncharacterized protein n=1 Tax=Rubroshorea leprosula TaxID=152421 RepID=A0AAV5KY81_9ROSI|nr:hypothetical protein SLEP1_g38821 [Rubroshorea leprosula]